jgi:hypothetical protein
LTTDILLSVLLTSLIPINVGVANKLKLSFIVSIGMKYAVVWDKQKKNKKSRQEAVFYKLEDAVMWEQHINMTEHAKTELHPIFSDS